MIRVQDVLSSPEPGWRKARIVDNFFSIENLHRSYLTCRKGKRKAINTRGFETNLFSELSSLSASLEDGSYQPSRSVCFYVTKPKLREIFAADFRDRVVHRLVVDILEPTYEKKFITDSFACRKGKGTHKAVERLKEFVRRGTGIPISEGFKPLANNRPFYFLQLDIKGFFMQIHKPTLIKILAREISPVGTQHAVSLRGVIEKIINHRPVDNFRFKGKIPPRGALPPHKTLFHDDKDRGIPIGNLTSQFFANIYLNELDQFVKRNLGVKYYIRYVDDFILMHHNPTQLLEWKEKIIHYLDEHLQLKLKETEVQPRSVYKGIDFLGYFVKPGYTLVRKRVVKNMMTAIAQSLPVKTCDSGSFGLIRFHKEFDQWKKLQSRINSYLGHCKMVAAIAIPGCLDLSRTEVLHRHPCPLANSFGLRKKVEDLLKPFSPMVSFQDDHVVIRPNLFYKYKNLREQISFFKKHFPDQLLIVRVGKFYELYGRDSEFLASILGLKQYSSRKETVYGMKYFHLKQLLQTVKQNHISGVLIQETDDVTDKIKGRLPVLKWKLLNPVQLELFK